MIPSRRPDPPLPAADAVLPLDDVAALMQPTGRLYVVALSLLQRHARTGRLPLVDGDCVTREALRAWIAGLALDLDPQSPAARWLNLEVKD